MSGSSNPQHRPAPPPPNPPGVILHRIGQACLACRRKKVKCDGLTPCHNCSSRSFTCEYPTSNDNASASRHYAKAFEERCQQLDQFCHRLESISSQLTQSIASISRLNLNSSTADHDELHQAAHLLQSLPARGADGTALSHRGHAYNSRMADGKAGGMQNESEDEDDDEEDDDEMEDEQDDDELMKRDSDPPEATNFGSLVSDSYGRLRYLGGANNVLVEAAKQHSPIAHSSSPSLSHPIGPGLSNSTNNAPSNKSTTGTTATAPDLELPIFVQGQRWPEMPYFPDPAVIPRPPQYVSDMLVNLYFDQLHYTFPILYKPHFMARYRQLAASPASAPASDRKFLSVFFAVCACSSGLLPSEGKRTDWPGLPYYQRSLILHYATTGEASVERVQCLGLLAMCSGGWNTLTQSWNFASQAVRAAQDLGMHLSGLTASSDQPSKLIKQQVSRRIWWSVYCLDRVTSICLGRPMAADDMDCHCILPLPLSDTDLESSTSHRPQPPTHPSPMTGFLALCSLCRIAGRIQRLHAPSRIRQLSRAHPQKQRDRFFRSVSSLQASLQKWLEKLPADVRASNATGAETGERRGPNLTMRVVVFMAHAGSMLNLFRMLSGTASLAALGAQANESISHCINAARSCIDSAELVREVVPPSHLLAFCVHYLTLSGIVLLRMPLEHRQDTLPDVHKCIRLLEGLELSWSGASKGRAIIEHLMKVTAEGDGVGAHEEPPPGYDDFGMSWGQMPGSELFGFETFPTEFFDV